MIAAMEKDRYKCSWHYKVPKYKEFFVFFHRPADVDGYRQGFVVLFDSKFLLLLETQVQCVTRFTQITVGQMDSTPETLSNDWLRPTYTASAKRMNKEDSNGILGFSCFGDRNLLLHITGEIVCEYPE